jgi:SnoaL-like domain
LVHTPALYRFLAGFLMWMLPRPGPRRLLFAWLVRRAYAAANRRDFDVLLLGLDPGIEFQPCPDLMASNQVQIVYGHNGYRQTWGAWVDAYADLRVDPEEIIDLGDRFLVTTRFKAHATPIDQPVFQLFKLERGLVLWQKDFADRSKALEAAGLSE